MHGRTLNRGQETNDRGQDGRVKDLTKAECSYSAGGWLIRKPKATCIKRGRGAGAR